MKITIELFAVLKEQAGLSKVPLELAEAKDLKSIYSDLASTFGFHLKLDSLKVAVNDEFTTWEHTLKEGDRVVFIPPVAGG